MEQKKRFWIIYITGLSGILVIVSARFYHLIFVSHLTEAEALKRYWPAWAIGIALCLVFFWLVRKEE